MSLLRRDFLLSGTIAAAAAGAAGATLAAGPVMAQNVGAVPEVRPPVPQDPEPYRGGTAVQSLRVINTLELEDAVRDLIPKGGFDYISTGSGGDWTLRENRAAFQRIQIEPQYLTGIAEVDTSVTILGSHLSMPIAVPPMGSHGLAHVSKEAGTARAVAQSRTLMISSNQSNLSMEEIAAVNPGPKWFQLYYPPDRGFARELVLRARAAGYTAIVATVDSEYGYPREANIRNGFRTPSSLGKGNGPRGITDIDEIRSALTHKGDLTWDDMSFVKEESGLPLIIKGVMSPKMAQTVVERGFDGVYVSNHGGRVMDEIPATITQLPRIADVVQGRVPLIFDSGIRRGPDIFKALALGADIVCCGRPVLYGLALGGWMGAHSVLEHLRENLILVMKNAGTPSLAAISRESLVMSAGV